MVKLLSVIIITLSLIGCGVAPTREVIVYQEKKVPVYVVPEPPVTQRPELEIATLSEEQKNDAGELSKALIISVKQLQQHIDNLEAIIEKQRDLSKKNQIIPPNNLESLNSD